MDGLHGGLMGRWLLTELNARYTVGTKVQKLHETLDGGGETRGLSSRWRKCLAFSEKGPIRNNGK